jgi:DNA-binding MarR family transcriptional regulator
MAVNAAERILSIYFPLVQLFREEFRSEAELTTDQFRILMMIRYDCNHIGKLAEQNSVSQPAMSKSVDALVNRGFVTRLDHPADRRQIRLELTKKGDAHVASIGGRIVQALRKRLAALPPAEQRNIAAAFATVTDLLSDGASQ